MRVRKMMPELKLGPTIVMLLGISLLAGCAPAPRARPVKMGDVDTGTNSLEATRRQLEGTWDLTALEIYDPPGGTPVRAEGATAVLCTTHTATSGSWGIPEALALCLRERPVS